MVRKIIALPSQVLKFAIRVYQKLFSFDHAFWAKNSNFRVCIYHPSCSEYTYEAIDKFGVIKGGYLGTKRVISCNPFSRGGDDPVPSDFRW